MPSNDMLARYLQAVGFWLPPATKQDILAEISEDLHSQIDDRAGSLGRPLNEAEVAEILKQRGRPVVVAGTFLPQRQLIGPVMFPIYVFVLKIVALCYFLPWFLVWLGYVIFDPSFGGLHKLGMFWSLVWTAFGIITFIFAILDRTSNRSKFVSDWDPRKLPKASHKQPSRKRRDIGAIVFGILYLGWLLVAPDFPFLVMGPAAYFVKFATVWHSVYPWLIALAAVGILEAAVSLLRGLPAWEAPAFKIANNCVCLCLLDMLWTAQTYFTAQAPQFQQYAVVANLVARICVAGTALGMLIALVVEAWHLVRALADPRKSAVTRIA
jgi:hypothetical protein